MADGHGGYRKPSNPAPVSGPGRLSKRTDGGPGQKLLAPTGMDYGERSALMDQERTAAMSQADSVPTANIPSPSSAASAGGGGVSGVVPYGAPSQRPNEPVTHGVDIGPGAGALQFSNSQQTNGQLTSMLAQMSTTDTTGLLGQLYEMAKQRGV